MRIVLTYPQSIFVIFVCVAGTLASLARCDVQDNGYRTPYHKKVGV